MHLIPAFALVLLTAAPSLAQAPLRAAVKSDGLVYLSGLTAKGPDITMQTAAALEKVAATLKARFKNSGMRSARCTSALHLVNCLVISTRFFPSVWESRPSMRVSTLVDVTITGERSR